MEAIGVIGTVVAVLDISLKITSLCREYHSRVKEAPQDIMRLHAEVRSIHDILQRISQAAATEDSSALLPSLRSLTTPDGALSICLVDLTSLTQILEKGKAGARKWRGILWPLKDSDVARSVKHIAQAKSTLQLALSADAGLNVLKVLKHTEVLAIKAKTKSLEKDEYKLDLLRGLPVIDCYIKHERTLQKRTEGTGAWLLQNEKYRKWREGDDPLLWVNGIPGGGKTVLCATVVEDLQLRQAWDPETLVVYFYFDSVFYEGASAEKLLSTVIGQIIHQIGDVPSEVYSYLQSQRYAETEPVNSRPRLQGHNLLDTLEGALCGLLDFFGRVHLVVDGLDEVRQEHMESLLSLFERIGNWDADVRILVFSRLHGVIRASFESQEYGQLSLEETSVANDIISLIEHRMTTNARFRKWPSKFKSEVKDRLIEQAGGMFQWTECQLAQLAACRTPNAARIALQQLPGSLEETYVRILQQVPEQDHTIARTIFRWLSFAGRPLRMSQLGEAVAIQEDSSGNLAYDPDSLLWDLIEVLDIASGLIVTSSAPDTAGDTAPGDTIVKLAHYTVKEFLMSGPLLQGPTATFALSSNTTHAFLAESCAAYLASTPLETVDEHPLHDYATRHWVSHMESCNANVSRTGAFLRFFQNSRAWKDWTREFDFERTWESPYRLQNSEHADDSPSLQPLYLAAYFGLLDVSESLLASGSDFDTDCGLLGSPLHAAAYRGHEDIVDLFLGQGADINKRSECKISTPFIGAVLGKHEGLAQYLVQRGARVQLNRFGFDRRYDGLFAAVSQGSANLTRLCLENGARDYLAPKSRPSCTMHAAVESGDEDLLSLMKQHWIENQDLLHSHTHRYEQIKPHHRNEWLKTIGPWLIEQSEIPSPLTNAINEGNSADVKRILLGDKARHRDNNWDDIFTAIKSENIAVVKAMCAIPDCTSLLFWHAGTHGNTTVIKLVVDETVNRAESGDLRNLFMTICKRRDGLASCEYLARQIDLASCLPEALLSAVEGGAIANFEYLLGLGRHVVEDRSWQHRALVQASGAGNVEMISKLLGIGVDPNAQCRVQGCNSCYFSQDPLVRAVRGGSTDAAMALLEGGYSLYHQVPASERVEDVLTQVIKASRGGDCSIAFELLRRGASPIATGPVHYWYHAWPLMAAVIMGFDGLLAALLDKGADAGIPSSLASEGSASSPLMTATLSQRISMMRQLVAAGANVNEANVHGYTAAHRAAGNRMNPGVLEVLINDLKADMDAKLENGSRPLHSAASYGRTANIEVLLDAGADIDATNNDGRTALHFAAEGGHWESVRHLLYRGARVDLRADSTRLTALDMAHLGRKGLTKYSYRPSTDSDVTGEELEELLERMQVKG